LGGTVPPGELHIALAGLGGVHVLAVLDDVDLGELGGAAKLAERPGCTFSGGKTLATAPVV
jgi:hypothetical protein